MAYVKRSSVPCQSCGSDGTMQVTMSLSGSPVSFTLCSECEWKSWEHEGEVLTLHSVLNLVTLPTP